MLHLTRTGECVFSTGDELETLRQHFDALHWVKVPGFFDRALFERIAAGIRRGRFRERFHRLIDSNSESSMEPDATVGLLCFLLNHSALFGAIEAIAACGKIASFQGRVYRIVPGLGHHDAWHSDTIDNRLVAISINLSEAPYVGGALQIRERSTGHVLHEIENQGAGDAIVFRLADHLQHRITEVSSGAPKTAFAGWFKSTPDYVARFRDAANGAARGPGDAADGRGAGSAEAPGCGCWTACYTGSQENTSCDRSSA